VNGKKFTVVSFTALNKAPIMGYLDQPDMLSA
jgi:hypothetical protein